MKIAIIAALAGLASATHEEDYSYSSYYDYYSPSYSSYYDYYGGGYSSYYDYYGGYGGYDSYYSYYSYPSYYDYYSGYGGYDSYYSYYSYPSYYNYNSTNSTMDYYDYYDYSSYDYDYDYDYSYTDYSSSYYDFDYGSYYSSYDGSYYDGSYGSYYDGYYGDYYGGSMENDDGFDLDLGDLSIPNIQANGHVAGMPMNMNVSSGYDDMGGMYQKFNDYFFYALDGNSTCASQSDCGGYENSCCMSVSLAGMDDYGLMMRCMNKGVVSSDFEMTLDEMYTVQLQCLGSSSSASYVAAGTAMAVALVAATI